MSTTQTAATNDVATKRRDFLDFWVGTPAWWDLVVLIEFRQGEAGCKHTMKALAVQLGRGERTVRRWMLQAEDAGYVSREGRTTRTTDTWQQETSKLAAAGRRRVGVPMSTLARTGLSRSAKLVAGETRSALERKFRPSLRSLSADLLLSRQTVASARSALGWAMPKPAKTGPPNRPKLDPKPAKTGPPSELCEEDGEGTVSSPVPERVLAQQPAGRNETLIPAGRILTGPGACQDLRTPRDRTRAAENWRRAELVFRLAGSPEDLPQVERNARGEWLEPETPEARQAWLGVLEGAAAALAATAKRGEDPRPAFRMVANVLQPDTEWTRLVLLTLSEVHAGEQYRPQREVLARETAHISTEETLTLIVKVAVHQANDLGAYTSASVSNGKSIESAVYAHQKNQAPLRHVPELDVVGLTTDQDNLNASTVAEVVGTIAGVDVPPEFRRDLCRAFRSDMDQAGEMLRQVFGDRLEERKGEVREALRFVGAWEITRFDEAVRRAS